MSETITVASSGPGTKRRIIESQMPLTAISVQSAREKSIRHGHLSTLHIWWARRPLAACRAAIFAALVPQPDDPQKAAQLQRFIAQLANWDNSIDSDSATSSTGVHHYIREARQYVKAAYPDRAPRVLDPFSGGGAIPLEALRLGCETYGLDLNPVAHIVELATLVYPQKYGRRTGTYGEKPGATLAGDIRKWSQHVLAKARAEIGDLYPSDADGSKPMAYFWARTVICPNAACSTEVPLVRQTWLVRKTNKYAAYRIESDRPGIPVRFRVIGPVPKARDLGFDPAQGTTRGGRATCPSCGTPLSEQHIKSEALAGRLGAVPVAVAVDTPGAHGKRYREITPTDLAAFAQAEQRLTALKQDYDPFSGELSPLPDERLVDNDTMNVKTPLYGLDTFDKLFNSRQALALSTIAGIVRSVHNLIEAENGDND